ncbi:MAG: hypothetical protein QXL22_01135 [Candidatus Nezhaarchaeales archaeon]
MVDKEKLAATLRKMLGVDVRFEKLSKEELLKLLEAVNKLLGSLQSVSEDRGILGLGVLPIIRNEVEKILPQIRSEVRELVRETVGRMLEERRKASGEGV